MYIYIYIYIYMCMYIPIYIYIYICVLRGPQSISVYDNRARTKVVLVKVVS